MGLEEAETAEFMAVKPFIGAIFAPSDAPSSPDLRAPDAELILEFAHGYRAHDARDNLRYTADGRIVYSTAALGVVMDIASREQQYFRRHENDIVSLAYHEGRDLVATGAMGKTPSIWVWNASTMEPVAELKGVLQREIVSLDFNTVSGAYMQWAMCVCVRARACRQTFFHIPCILVLWCCCPVVVNFLRCCYLHLYSRTCILSCLYSHLLLVPSTYGCWST